MSNFINAGVEELKERLKINHEEIGYLETRLDRAKKDNKKLEEENKKLKEDLAFERTMLDNVRAEYESSQKLIRWLREELSHFGRQEI